MSAPLPGPPRPGVSGERPRPAPPGGPRPGPPGAVGSAYDLGDGADGAGHPAVEAVLQSLANAAQLPPAAQVAEYEAAHRVLQETLAGIDRA